MKWNPELYDKKHDFVAEHGKGLLEFVPSDKSLSVLDLGCGTGTLTDQLVPLCGRVVGIDGSEDMIERARAKYAQIDFRVCDALQLPFRQEFDIVFSNAVFHWIKNQDLLLKNVNRALKENGMLICEFGGEGNIAAIEQAFSNACKGYGYDYVSQFHFPPTLEFEALLVKNGFAIEQIYDYDRPRPLKGGEEGLENWMKQFFASDLEKFEEKQQNEIIRDTEASLRDKLWNGREWVADYRRLRAIARKTEDEK